MTKTERDYNTGTKGRNLLAACVKLALDKGLWDMPKDLYCEYLVER